MFVKINGKRFWLKVVDGMTTLSFICEELKSELVLINGTKHWTLQDVYDSLEKYSKMEDLELIKLAKETL